MSINLHFPPEQKIAAQANRVKNSLTRNWRIALILLLVLLLATTTIAALLLLAHQKSAGRASVTAASPVVPVVGRVSFVSSGKLYVNNNQGINDEVLIDLHHIAPPATGQSYYGWLLGDSQQTDVPWVALGALPFSQGSIHYLYPGDAAHSNLLSDMSRFLITQSDATVTPLNPLLDQSAWRYYGQIYQAPSPKDPNHFSLLDHLRHIIVQAPELQAQGLQGGLSIWLMRNTEEILKWSVDAKDRFQNGGAVRGLLVDILSYLDGECTSADLQGVPPGTPTTVQNATIARIAHFALLNPCIQEEQEQATVLKEVFVHVPHNYVDHFLFHLAGIYISPGVTSDVRALAIQLNRAINNMRNWLGQVREDAVALIHMSDQQLTQIAAFNLVSDMELEARYAFAGRTDSNTGITQEGAAWIFDNVERLTMMEVTPFSSH